jgi:hypothetical protein
MEMTAIITPSFTYPLSFARSLAARSGESLAGLMTRSGMLDAHPRQDVLLSFDCAQDEAAGLYHRNLFGDAILAEVL